MSQLLQNIDQEKLNEMAMVDIAFEILKEQNRPYNFRELMGEIAALRNMTEEQMMSMIAQVYTEVNIDGRFICLGDNTWGLKRWYPMETVEESQEGGGKKKKLVSDDDFDDDYELDEELDEVYEEDDDLIAYDDEEDFIDEDLDDDDEIEEDLDEEELFEEDLVDEELEEENEED